jgi:hypothetical protein
MKGAHARPQKRYLGDLSSEYMDPPFAVILPITKVSVIEATTLSHCCHLKFRAAMVCWKQIRTLLHYTQII